ncbi:MAG: hypothetical protein EOM87_01805 [Clostridia bacterium]|nr:hypothetical protein [Clostridia bacterium]
MIKKQGESKRGAAVAALLILLIIIAVFITACKTTDNAVVVNIAVESNADTVEAGAFNINDYVLNVTYADGNVRTMTLKQDMLDAGELAGLNTPGVHRLTVNINGVTTIITVTITKKHFSSVKFEDKIFLYDGEEKSLSLTGLPEGAEVVFDTERIAYTEKGSYTVTATVSLEGYITEDFTATLYITDQIYGGSAICFEDVTAVYDGTEKSVAVIGAPKGSIVSYDVYNRYVHPGIYNITVTVTMEGENDWTKTAALTILKADYDISALCWVCDWATEELVYDGTAHNVSLEGVPEGVIATVDGNTGTAAAGYIATAEFVYDAVNYNELSIEPYSWTINKADYDMSGVHYYNSTLVYDKTEHSLLLTGILPDGVEAVYSDNTLTEVGYTAATASFGYDYENYNPIDNLTATLTIVKADYNMSAVTFNSATYVYSGGYRTLTLTGVLPEGIECEYFLAEGEESYPISLEEIAISEPGSKTVTVKFLDTNIDSENYNRIADKTAILTVVALPLSEISFTSASFVYDGEPHSIYLDGVPENMLVEYDNNEKTAAGEYAVTATILQYNELSEKCELAAISAVLTIETIDCDMSGVTFANAEYAANGTLFEVSVAGTLPEGVTVTYSNNHSAFAGATDNGAITVGEYIITASFHTDSNHTAIADMTATLSIVHFDYLNDALFEDAYCPYTGEEIVLEVSNIPDNVSVYYPNGNGRTTTGTKVVTADFYSCEDGVNSVYLGSRTAILEIIFCETTELADIYFRSATYVYDGTQKAITLSGQLPTGYTVTYVDNTLTDAGNTYAYATIRRTADSEIMCVLEAALIITQAVPGITFADAAFAYDGDAHYIYAAGLPYEILASYENNSRIDPGEHMVAVSFYYRNPSISHNYSLPDDMTATLTITKLDFDMSGVSFRSEAFFYDGLAHSLIFDDSDLPQNLYYEIIGNSRINMGQQTVTVNFYADYYFEEYYTIPEPMTAELKVVNNPLATVGFPGATYTYSPDTERSVLLANADGIVVKYSNNTQSQAGSYCAGAVIGTYNTLTGAFISYYTFESTLIINKATLVASSYGLNSATYTYDGTVRALELAGELPEELEVVYQNNGKTNAGVYRVTASIASKEGYDNYILPIPYVATLTINTRHLQVVFEGETYLEYTGAAQKNVTCTATGKIGGDTVNISLTYSGDMIECGVYTVTASINNPNYSLNADNTYTVTIVRKLFIVIFSQRNSDTIVYLPDGEALNSELVPNLITLPGYNAAWETFDYTVTANKTINAQYVPIVYNIAYEFNGGYNNSGNPATYTVETTAITLADAAKQGDSVFNGWYTTPTFIEGTRKYVINSGSWGNIKLYANWIDCPIIIPDTFSLNCSGAVPVITLSVGNEISGVDLLGQISVGAEYSWKLYEDYACATEYGVNNSIICVSLSEGDNIVYVLVSKNDGSASTRYILDIYRNHIYNYRVNYGDGSSSIIAAEEGTQISGLLHANKEGYIFTGWTVEDEIVEFPYIIDRNGIDFVAAYDRIAYSVFYDLDGGTNSGQNPSNYTVTTGFVLFNPVRPYYLFDGWYNQDDQLVIIVNETGDIYLKAIWTAVNYNIFYVLSNGENNMDNPTDYTVEDSFTLKAPTRNGYVFDGWYTENTYLYKVTAISSGSHGTLVLYAKWSPSEYSISYNLQDGVNSEYNPESYTIEDRIELAEPTKNGYSFDGWRRSNFIDGVEYFESVTIIDGATGDLALIAYWSDAIQYGISYFNTDWFSNPNPPVFTVLSETITLESPSSSPNGYTFGGWYNDVGFVSAATEIASGSTGDISLYAKWVPVQYGITYNLLGGENDIDNPTSFTIEDTFTLADASKSGFTFGGWYGDVFYSSERITEISNNYGNLALYARWTSEAELAGVYTRTEYTVTFDSNGGGAVPSRTVTDSEQLSIPAPSRNGYLFKGWYEDSSCTIPFGIMDNEIYSDTTLYAGWTVCSYSNGGFLSGSVSSAVTYSGSADSRNTAFYFYTYESSVTLYYYNGSSGGRTHYQIYDETTGSLINTYGYFTNTSYSSATFSTNRGHLYRILPYASGISYTTTAYLYLSGCSVTAAYAESGTFARGSINSGNKVVELTYGQSFNLEIPVKNGATFTGWFNGATRVTYNNGSSSQSQGWSYNGRTVLTPKYNYTIYNIIYKAGEATITDSGNPATYTVEHAVTFVDYLLEGYTFEGWYTDIELTVKIEDTDGLWADFTLYAKLTKEIELFGCRYEVSFDSQGGSSEDAQYIDDVTELTLPMTTRTNYMFKGWYEDSGCTQFFDAFNITIDSNISLYAGWTACSYINGGFLSGSSSSAQTYSGSETASNTAFYFYADGSSVSLHYCNGYSGDRTYYQIYDETTGSLIITYGPYTNTSYSSATFDTTRGHLYRVVPYAYSSSYTTTAYLYLSGDYVATTEDFETNTFGADYGLSEAVTVTVMYNYEFSFIPAYNSDGYYIWTGDEYERITDESGSSLSEWTYDTNTVYAYNPAE